MANPRYRQNLSFIYEASMLKLIIEKELREIIGSTKFAITFGVCAMLILLAFYVGAKHYQVSRAQYEAAKVENLRQMEGLTDWMEVRDHRIFLPPQPLAALVTGIANDLGRTVVVQGRGELAAEDSRFNDDPIFAIFRFLDLDFIFQIVLSLFAILFAYDAINGEKERGTLRLSFANAIPRDQYLIGKIAGAFLALAAPLLIPILIGGLLLPLLGVPLAGEEWARLALIVFAGLLYFGVFLTLSILISALTHRSSSSFLVLLVAWIFAVLIVPRVSVLLAGRAVEVPSVDEIASQKSRLSAQLWKEDREKMTSFKPAKTDDPEEMLRQFNKFMQDNADERDKKMNDLAERLNEDRRNRQQLQERVAFGLARISPAAAFSLAAANLAGTSIALKQDFIDAATNYQNAYAQFIKGKTGMNLGGGFVRFHMRLGNDDEPKQKPIDPNEIPPFQYLPKKLSGDLGSAILDIGILLLFNGLFFAGAFVAFLRYDVR
jgi:ABC-type transport system involved in multi-copper enzyme maturation permease subunit